MPTETATLPGPEWTGSDEWKAHLSESDDHDPASCPGCAVRPLLAEIYQIWITCSQQVAEIIYSMQDGYGSPGFMPEQGYDWSGIRDSSPAAVHAIWLAVHS